MPNGLEIVKAAIDDFKDIQEYMLLAKKENAAETYAKLKKKGRIIQTEYLSVIHADDLINTLFCNQYFLIPSGA